MRWSTKAPDGRCTERRVALAPWPLHRGPRSHVEGTHRGPSVTPATDSRTGGVDRSGSGSAGPPRAAASSAPRPRVTRLDDDGTPPHGTTTATQEHGSGGRGTRRRIRGRGAGHAACHWRPPVEDTASRIRAAGSHTSARWTTARRIRGGGCRIRLKRTRIRRIDARRRPSKLGGVRGEVGWEERKGEVGDCCRKAF